MSGSAQQAAGKRMNSITKMITTIISHVNSFLKMRLNQ